MDLESRFSEEDIAAAVVRIASELDNRVNGGTG
jgi:hypothetical protein